MRRNNMGFNMSDAVASRWMAKEDVGVNGVTLTIAGTTKEEFDGETRYALHFHQFGGTWKPLLLNKSAIRTLIALFGDNSDAWTGKQIVAWNDLSVNFNGKIGAVRLRPYVQPTAAPHAPQYTPAPQVPQHMQNPLHPLHGMASPAQAAPDFNDDVPL
jgi:hypothetical protein